MTKNDIISTLEDMKEYHVYMDTLLKGTLETLWETGDNLTPFGVEKVERIIEAINKRKPEVDADIENILKGLKEYKDNHKSAQ